MSLRIIIDLFDPSDVFTTSDIAGALDLVRDQGPSGEDDGAGTTAGGVEVRWRTEGYDRCMANSQRGTGTGMCMGFLDAHGQCSRASRHV